MRPFRLRCLPIGARFGITCFLLVLVGGYGASLRYLFTHYAVKDEQDGLSMDDLVGSFHGIQQTAPLLAALEGKHGRQYAPDDAERQLLIDWLKGDPASIPTVYDEVEDEDDLAPADILDLRCASCHQRTPDDAKIAAGEHSAQPLDNWPDIQRVAFSREFNPVPVEILTISTHVHASMLPILGLAVGLLLLATRMLRPWHGLLIGVTGVGLLLDLGSMWLARSSEAWVYGIVAGGALFGLGFCLQILVVLLELWLGSATDENQAPVGS